MALLDFLGGAASAVGKFSMDTASEYIKKNIVDERDARLDEMLGRREEARDNRQAGLLATAATEERAGRERAAVSASERAAAAVALAEKTRRDGNLHDLSPTVVAAKAKAATDFAELMRPSIAKDEKSKLDTISTAAADSFTKNWINPDYQKAARAKMLAEHPPESSATAAQARLANFQLGQAQELAKMHTDLAKAEGMPAGAEKSAAVKAAQDQISSRGYTGKWANVAPLLTAGTTLMKAAEGEVDPAAKSSLQAQASVFFKMAGVKEDAPAIDIGRITSRVAELRKAGKSDDVIRAGLGEGGRLDAAAIDKIMGTPAVKPTVKPDARPAGILGADPAANRRLTNQAADDEGRKRRQAAREADAAYLAGQ